MKPTEFVKVNTRFWGEHLREVSGHLPVSHRTELPGPLLFPRMMVLTEAPDWNVLELVGLSREYRALEVRRQKVASVEEYFGVADGSAVVRLGTQDQAQDATIATEPARRALDERYPSAIKFLGQEYVGAADQLFQFAPGNYTTFDRTLLAHGTDDALRLHWTFLTVAIHRSEPVDSYLQYLRDHAGTRAHLDPIGTLSVPVDPAALRHDAFASTFLAHGLQDLTVEQFLDTHEEILLSALDGTALHRQSVAEGPDFVVDRADGSTVQGVLDLPLLQPNAKPRHRPTDRPLPETAGRFDRSADARKLVLTSSQTTVPAAALTEAGVEVVDYDTLLRLHLAATS